MGTSAFILKQIIAFPAIMFWGLATMASPSNNSGNDGDSRSDSSCIITKQGAEQDSMVWISAVRPDLNNYTAPNPSITDIVTSWWTYGGTPYESRALMKFTLPVIPSGNIVNSASLSLFAADSASPNGVPGRPMYGNNNSAYLKRINSPWSLLQTTWNHQPTITDSDEVLIPQSDSSTQDYLDIDITQFVQFWLQNPDNNYGIMIEMIDSAYLNSLIFCSSNYPDVDRRPVLNICYINCSAAASFIFQNLDDDTIQFANISAYVAGQIATWAFSNDTGIIGTSTRENPIFSFTGPTPYSATLYLSNQLSPSCRDSITKQIVASGIMETSKLNNLNIFPNPNSGYSFQIEIPGCENITAKEIKILDVLGRQMVITDVERNTNAFKVSFSSSLPSGVFNVVIENGTKLYAGKLVIVQ